MSTSVRPGLSDPSTAKPVAPRPYRDFVTTLLHRRFFTVCLTVLAVCYVNAIWFAGFDLLWSWFPLGPTGIRSLLLFICGLLVLTLRIANLCTGARSTQTPYQTFTKSLLRLTTYRILILYSISAWLFGELYLWAAPVDSQLGWVYAERAYERARLNERPIYLRTALFFLAIAQTVVHIVYDYDRVRFHEVKIKETGTPLQKSTPIVRLQKALLECGTNSLYQVGVVSLMGPFIYHLFFRETLWNKTYYFVSFAFSLPANYGPGTFPGWADTSFRFFTNGFLLSFLWQFANATFDIYIAQPPLIDGLPITNRAKDPNGALLSGLRSKKHMPHAYALYELLIIAQSYPERRASLYLDIDRTVPSAGTSFAHIKDACLAEVELLAQRVSSATIAPKPVSSITAAKGGDANSQVQSATVLPKIAKPIHHDSSIFANGPPTASDSRLDRATRDVGGFFKAHGHSPPQDRASLKSLSPKARKLLQLSTSSASEQGGTSSPLETARNSLQHYATTFLASPVGWFFRGSFSRNAQAVVAGVPRGRNFELHAASVSLSALVVHGLAEDRYGQVAPSVPSIVRGYVEAIRAVTNLVRTQLPVPWTDIRFRDDDRLQVLLPTQQVKSDCDSVATTLELLRQSLREVLLAYGEYATGLGLSSAELREAKDLAAGGGEHDTAHSKEVNIGQTRDMGAAQRQAAHMHKPGSRSQAATEAVEGAPKHQRPQQTQPMVQVRR